MKALYFIYTEDDDIDKFENYAEIQAENLSFCRERT